jgi:hypothetical protein
LRRGVRAPGRTRGSWTASPRCVWSRRAGSDRRGPRLPPGSGSQWADCRLRRGAFLSRARLGRPIIAAHRDSWAAVGGVLENANPATRTSWAALVSDFGPAVAPVEGGEASELPSHHTTYKRDVLLRYGPDLDQMLEIEWVLQEDLRASGERLFREPRAVSRDLNVSRLRSHLLAEFDGGRSFAGNPGTPPGLERGAPVDLGGRVPADALGPAVPVPSAPAAFASAGPREPHFRARARSGGKRGRSDARLRAWSRAGCTAADGCRAQSSAAHHRRRARRARRDTSQRTPSPVARSSVRRVEPAAGGSLFVRG